MLRPKALETTSLPTDRPVTNAVVLRGSTVLLDRSTPTAPNPLAWLWLRGCFTGSTSAIRLAAPTRITLAATTRIRPKSVPTIRLRSRPPLGRIGRRQP